jgi:ATP-dependent DNA helicase DinG
LIEVRRKEAEEEGMDPLTVVDYPEMGLKLKQGCGRLIRTKDDRGAIAVLEPVTGTTWEKVAIGALPKGAKIKTISKKI